SDDIKKLMMGLLGVTIVKSSGDTTDKKKPEIIRKYSVLDFKDLIGTPSQSSATIKVWACQLPENEDPDCTSVTEQTETITPFSYLVRQAMDHGINAIQARTSQSFSPTEKFFLSGSTMPLWKLISNGASMPLDAGVRDTYAQIIATEVAGNFALMVMREAGRAIAQME
ncbi:MAG: conjugal transfer protein TraH, partial [Chloroflexus sp.]